MILSYSTFSISYRNKHSQNEILSFLFFYHNKHSRNESLSLSLTKNVFLELFLVFAIVWRGIISLSNQNYFQLTRKMYLLGV